MSRQCSIFELISVSRGIKDAIARANASYSYFQVNEPHCLLETVVADAYRCGEISTAEVGQILQLPSRLETHAFLKRMGVYLNYDEAELEQDLQTLKKFRAQ